jgi:hypothetical protein
MKRTIALVVTLVLLAGCATQPVEAWQRGALARRDMSLQRDPLGRKYFVHLHDSKEAANGGEGAGGGGCGCN